MDFSLLSFVHLISLSSSLRNLHYFFNSQIVKASKEWKRAKIGYTIKQRKTVSRQVCVLNTAECHLLVFFSFLTEKKNDIVHSSHITFSASFAARCGFVTKAWSMKCKAEFWGLQRNIVQCFSSVRQITFILLKPLLF